MWSLNSTVPPNLEAGATVKFHYSSHAWNRIIEVVGSQKSIQVQKIALMAGLLLWD